MRSPRQENVASYEVNQGLGRDEFVYLAVKGFNQQAIVDKIIERKGNKALGLTAVEDTRERRYSAGLLLFTDLDLDRFTDDLLEGGTSVESMKPYHLACSDDLLAYTAGDQLGIVGPDGRRFVTNDWMAYLHTADFAADHERALVVSTGFDTIQEIDLTSSDGAVSWEWNGWDNGFTYSESAQRHYVRSPQQAIEIRDESPGSDIVIVEDPNDWPAEGLATQETPLNLNSAFYGPPGSDGRPLILATGYHRSELFVIDRATGLQRHEIGLRHPHSFRPVSSEALTSDAADQLGFDYRYMVSSTGDGKLLLLDEAFEIAAEVDFGGIDADRDKKAGFGEWLQTVSFLDESTGLIAGVDALRNGIHIVDLVRRRRRFIPNPGNWTIQTCAPITERQAAAMAGSDGLV